MKIVKKSKTKVSHKLAAKDQALKRSNDGPTPGIEDAPFFKEKMRIGEEILKRVGLPKGY